MTQNTHSKMAEACCRTKLSWQKNTPPETLLKDNNNRETGQSRDRGGAWEDTEHQGHKGQQRQAEPQVGHVVLPLRLGQAVGQSGLQAHKQHTGGEGDASAHVVKNFGVIHLLQEEKRRKREGFGVRVEQKGAPWPSSCAWLFAGFFLSFWQLETFPVF